MNKKYKHVIGALIFTVVVSSLQAQIPAEALQKIASATAVQPKSQSQTHYKILVFTRTEGYRHQSIPFGVEMLGKLAENSGLFTIEQSEEYAVFSQENLKKFDAILFLNTTGINLGDSQYGENILQFVKSGKGFIGIHSATDNFDKWPQAAAMIGGRFAGHPWTAGGTWAVKLDDANHPICAAFGGKGFKINDEIYRIAAPFSREKCRVLASLDLNDQATAAAKGQTPNDIDLPIVWIKPFGKGRVFYSSFGHNKHIYWNEKLIAHYLAGIRYALGDLQVADMSSVEQYLRTVASYRYGQDRSDLVALNLYIRKSITNRAALQRLEKNFIKILGNKQTPLAAQQYICDRLSIMGSAASVKVLTKLLRRNTSTEFARFALERIPAPAAGQALRKSLSKLNGGAKIGVINSLGVRQEQAAVRDLGKLLFDKNEAIATAAARALGVISGDQAIEKLWRGREKLQDPVRANIVDALLNSADHYAAAGNHQAAQKIYQALKQENESISVRRAAIRGEILANPSRAADLIMKILSSGSTKLHPAAFDALRDLPPETDLTTVAALLQRQNFQGKAALLTALGTHNQPAVTAAAMRLAKNENPATRQAALSVLAQVGKVPAVAILADAASRRDSLAAIARASLYRLPGVTIDAEIMRMLPQADAPVKIELLKAVYERNIANSENLVLAMAADENPRITLAAARILRLGGSIASLPGLVKLLQKDTEPAVATALQKAVIAIARRAEDEVKTSNLLLKVLQQSGDRPAAVALLPVLAELGQNNALPVLLENLSSNNAKRRNAAIQALAAWPDSRPVAELFKIASSFRKDTQQILALRAYVGLKSRQRGNPVALVADFRRAMDLAANLAEKRRVLAALANVPYVEAAKLVQQIAKTPELKAEADFALVSIAEKGVAENPSFYAEILQPLASAGANPTLGEKAKTILRLIKDLNGHIVQWQVSGPWIAENVDLFAHVFPPEISMISDSGWHKMPAITLADAPWFLDLYQAIGGSNRVAYLRTAVAVPKAGKYKLELGSDDGVKVWVNGKNVFNLNVTRGVVPADNSVPVDLQKGRNTLLLKICQSGGGWGACARLRNRDGSEIEGLQVVKF